MIRRQLALAVALAATLALTGCATPRPGEEPVPLAPKVSLMLPAPGDLGRPVDAVQQVTAEYPTGSAAFEARLSVTAQRLLLVATDGMGRRGLTVTWTPGAVQVERAAWLPDSVRPENILATIVLLYWPEAVVRQALAGSGATLEQTPGVRIVRDRDNQPALIARYAGSGDAAAPWTGTAQLRNLPWNYSIDVQSNQVGG